MDNLSSKLKNFQSKGRKTRVERTYSVKEFFYDTSFIDYDNFFYLNIIPTDKIRFVSPGISFRELDISSVAMHFRYSEEIAQRITEQSRDIIREYLHKLPDFFKNLDEPVITAIQQPSYGCSIKI